MKTCPLLLILLCSSVSAADPFYVPYEGGGYETGVSFNQRRLMARYEAEKERRRLARQRFFTASVPSDELRAESWLRMAGAFEQRGEYDRSASVRRSMIRLYPSTDAAKGAEQWLMERGY